MPYDVREARHALAGARAAKYPHDYTANRQQAAAALVSDVLDVAKAIGFATAAGAQPGTGAIIPNPNASRRVELASDERGVYVQVSEFGHTAKVLSPPEIEYDPATDQ